MNTMSDNFKYPKPLKKKVDAIKDEDIAKALWATKGLQYLAAEMLGCSPGLVCLRIKESPYLQAVVYDAREKRIDLAEKALSRLIEQDDTTAILFLLKTIGKKRGYEQEVQKVVDAKDYLDLAISQMKNQTKELVDEPRKD